ncbi:MAG: hypothetical protein PHS54_06585 [Clostridia bacterium]|jgi:hypothetical protein|nr:hypothetical protein [Clostridia bacterium]
MVRKTNKIGVRDELFMPFRRVEINAEIINNKKDKLMKSKNKE